MLKNIKLFFAVILLMIFMSCNEEVKNEHTKQKRSPKINSSRHQQKLKLLNHHNARQELSKYAEENSDTNITIETRFGIMKIRLYKETKLHRANFIRLIKRKYFDHTVFYRVIKHFVVQGGMSDVRNPVPLGKYRVPKEFMPQKYYHKKGALAMARDENYKNPKKNSSPKDFFIVHGKKYSLGELMAIEQDYGLKFTPQQIQTYTTIGGAPHLDNDYTVFGEVVEGLAIIDSITNLKVDKGDWPLEDVGMKVRIKR